MNDDRLAILGAGGHGRVVADAALLAGWGKVVFFDDRFPELETTGEWRVVGTVQDLFARCMEMDGIVVAIGDNRVRLHHHQQLAGMRANLASVVHPRAWSSPRAAIGAGYMLSAGAIVNVGTAIGAASIVNTGATVDHDCMIGDGVHIAPGVHLSGGVEVGAQSWIGVGATIRQGITIGDRGHDRRRRRCRIRYSPTASPLSAALPNQGIDETC